MSSFTSLNTALSGLLAHRRALDVIGHNITNVDTTGFSRRRVELASTGQWAVPAMFSRSAATGAGVTIEGVTRIRDEFLEGQARLAHATSSRLDVEAAMLARIEGTVPEPSDVGLAAQLGDFWAAWDDVANNPGDTAGRIAVLQQAATVASSFNRIAADMRAVRNAAVDEAEALVAAINASAARIAELNGAVSRATAAGLDPHDLADQRDQLVMELSEMVGVTVRQGELGSVDVLLGGTSLIRGDHAESLQVAEPAPLGAPYAGTGLDRVEIQWSIDGYPATVASGRVAGLLTVANEYVPRSITDLDAVANALVTSVNALHQTGQGLDTVLDVNLDFFDAAGTTADTIAVSTDVRDQPTRVAAAVAGAGTLDGSLAQQMAAMESIAGGPDALYQSLVGRLAVETQASERRSAIQAEVTLQADDDRLSVSGVNLDEELTALVTTQRAYEAAARLLTTVDQTLDTLINRTGVVGR